MPKERIKAQKNRPVRRAVPKSGARSHEQSANTRIDTLRKTYGDSFAPGIRGDAHLQTLLDRTGSSSLSDYLKTNGHPPVNGADGEDSANQKSTNVRYATAERFNEAHRKTSSLHAGLFRRLAE